jgi:hypothetical protein
MRVPKKNLPDNTKKIRNVHIDKPIIVPRLPVITTDKQRVKLIKKIESYCRSAMEYTDLTTYLRKYVNMEECTFLSNFKAGKKRGMIEIHHAPFTLFSLVDIVMRKQEKEYGYIDEFVVVDEVLRLHYSGLVGLIPLSVTVHQLVHDNRIDIPLWTVYGRFVEFTKTYFDYIPDEVLDSLKEEIKISEILKNDPKAFEENMKILNVEFIYLDVDGERKIRDIADKIEISS